MSQEDNSAAKFMPKAFIALAVGAFALILILTVAVQGAWNTKPETKPAPSLSLPSTTSVPANKDPQRFDLSKESHPPVPESYFDDVLFVGDSVISGLEIYDIIPQADYLWSVGITPQGACTSEEFTSSTGAQVTMLEAMEDRSRQPSKIYFMLGMNGIKWLPPESMISSYADIIDYAKEAFPKATIYVQSLTPTAEDVYATIPGIDKENIGIFNAALRDVALEKQVYYLDVYSALCDENGYLPEEVSSDDGYHFSPSHYQRWYTYLRTHVAK